MRTLVRFAALLRHGIAAFFRSHLEQAIIETALRQQLAAYARKRPRPKLSPLDRAFWVALSRLWPRWKNHLVVVRPETVVRWHREGFRMYWRSIVSRSTQSGQPSEAHGRTELRRDSSAASAVSCSIMWSS